MKLFLPLSLPFLVLLGVGVFAIAKPLAHPTPPPPGSPGALVWGNGIFASKSEVRAWLRLHGASYDDWVRQHPLAVRLVAPRRVSHPKAKRHPAGGATKTRVTPKAVPASATKHAVAGAQHVTAIAPTKTSRQTKWSWAALLFLVGGAVPLSAALLPPRVLERFGGSPVRASGVRVGLASIGVAILLGLIVAIMFG
jgi:hypothetical protein